MTTSKASEVGPVTSSMVELMKYTNSVYNVLQMIPSDAFGDEESRVVHAGHPASPGTKWFC